MPLPRGNTDWGTRISLGVVVVACLAIAWRVAPKTPKPVDPAVNAPTDAAREKDIHGQATGPAWSGPSGHSPFQTILEKAAQDGGTREAALGYDLAHPEHTYRLGKDLDEISDLSMAPDSKSLWAVNDEQGVIYRVSTADGEVLQSIPFGERGDYEGLEQLDGGVLVARSDGQLFLVDLADAGVSTFESNLGPSCNLEGLGWDPRREKLLMACKGEMPRMPKGRKSFAIYAMDLATRRVQRQPVIVINHQVIDDYLGTHTDQANLHPSMADDFAPSAIAVHPLSGQIYLLSARGNMLVVLESNGSLVRVDGLDPVANPQPEGIAFAPDGTMYISNESRGAHALMHRFPPSGGVD